MLPSEKPNQLGEERRPEDDWRRVPRWKSVTMEEAMAELERIMAAPEAAMPQVEKQEPERWDGMS